MVTNTSTTDRAQRVTTIDAASATTDRYRPALSFSPRLAARPIEAWTRATAPVSAAFTGEVCPVAVGARMEKSPMSWQHRTTTTHNSIVFGGFGFGQLTDDIDTRLGAPPPRRPSV